MKTTVCTNPDGSCAGDYKWVHATRTLCGTLAPAVDLFIEYIDDALVNGMAVSECSTANFNNYIFTNGAGTGPAYTNMCVKAGAGS